MVGVDNMDEVKVDEFSVAVMVKWTCPKCGHKNENHWSGSPYTAVAEDGLDEDCGNCKEWFTLSMYDND